MFNETKNGNPRFSTRDLAYSAVMAAVLTGGKQMLHLAPGGVEVLTVLILAFAAAFSFRSVFLATVAFCALQTVFYGIYYWVILYLIYYPLLVCAAQILKKVKPLPFKTAAAAVLGVVMTVFFNGLSVIIDAAFKTGAVDFWTAVQITFIQGVMFFGVHIAFNAVVIPALFPALYTVFGRITQTKKGA